MTSEQKTETRTFVLADEDHVSAARFTFPSYAEARAEFERRFYAAALDEYDDAEDAWDDLVQVRDYPFLLQDGTQADPLDGEELYADFGDGTLHLFRADPWTAA
jgi:hypothetical protein